MRMWNNGPDQTDEQLQGRVNWRATDKISFEVNAGFEDIQFLASGISDSLSPTFGAAIQYQPFKQTQISLNASRTVTASSYSTSDAVTETTGIGCNLNQRLLEKLSLNLGVGYTETKYSDSISASVGTLSENREDDYSYFSASLSRPFLKRGTLSATYQYSDNSSTAPGFSYSSNQIGIQIGYSY